MMDDTVFESGSQLSEVKLNANQQRAIFSKSSSDVPTQTWFVDWIFTILEGI